MKRKSPYQTGKILNKCLYGDQYHLTVPRAQLSTHRGRIFFEVIRWQITGVSNDRRLKFIFFQWFISNMSCFCHYGPALLGFWFQTDLGREISASFFKNTGGGRPFLTMITLYVQFLCSDWSKFILFIFYFILLFCHTQWITRRIKTIINRLINIKFKICALLGRSDCGGEISEKPSLWGIEISPPRAI